MTFFSARFPAVNPRWRRCQRESGSYALIKQAISRCPVRPKGCPAEVILPPGVRGDSREEAEKKETESERMIERTAYIALGSSRLHRINGDDITLLHTHVDARVRAYSSLYNTDWRTERVRTTWRISVQWDLFVAVEMRTKKAAFLKGKIRWHIPDACYTVTWLIFVIRISISVTLNLYRWLRKIIDTRIYWVLISDYKELK